MSIWPDLVEYKGFNLKFVPITYIPSPYTSIGNYIIKKDRITLKRFVKVSREEGENRAKIWINALFTDKETDNLPAIIISKEEE